MQEMTVILKFTEVHCTAVVNPYSVRLYH